MSRGFTLLELLLTVVVLSILLTVAIPNFDKLTSNAQMTRLADDLQGFLIQSKSEAVWRNQDLWAHFTLPTNPTPAGDWKVTLTDSDIANAGNKILILDGALFKDVVISSSYSSNRVKLTGSRGRISGGNLKFYRVGNSNQTLQLKTGVAASRIMICGVGGSYYGYPSC
ncbi:GspH/FimT family protein [Vibrio sp. NTOU-M3]|uniref:GspH/FimT family protein n=1 Tax=Vibrio sp. NTOU-M3 TaxID=3234954 RepID=UPI00349F76FA